jgi:oxygen-independent coproporphyrinogen III oxidase
MPHGVYLHIPFCLSRCSYCDFAVSIYQEDLAEKYVRALCQEISNSKFQIPNSKIDTVYFGGGTPSLLSSEQAEKILATVFDNFAIASDAEITMEMNPATLTLEKAKDFRALGVNRASFGAQTFDDDELKRLGRRHTALDVRKTIDLLRAADFTNVSFDLIAGLPRQTLADWERNLDEALRLKPEHLSLYLLEIHEGTPLAQHVRTGKQPQPDDDLAGEMYELLLDKIARSDYAQYEISNFCLPGCSSRHNLKYWRCEPVVGFGCSAHSFDGRARRWANERDTRRYIETIENGESPIVETIELDEKTRRAEFAFLNLRLEDGIDLTEYQKRFGINLLEEYTADFKSLFDAGLLETESNRLRLTRRGKLLSNEVFAIFV